MGNIVIILLMYVDICIALGCYFYFLRMKKKIGLQLGMNISMVMGGMAGLLSGILLILQFPFHFTLITVISTIIGGITGGLFGLLFNYQIFVMGATNAIVIGLMSPMIGTVLEMPSVYVWFIQAVFILSLLTIIIAIKRS
ncbi:hypothetical protein [Lederbergia citrea]